MSAIPPSGPIDTQISIRDRSGRSLLSITCHPSPFPSSRDPSPANAELPTVACISLYGLAFALAIVQLHDRDIDRTILRRDYDRLLQDAHAMLELYPPDYLETFIQETFPPLSQSESSSTVQSPSAEPE
ncbi:hypothetical protein [Synechococcus sp. PCC 7336]|uniref:hypothetical protein n=1 Tax=Synechococcus sp. PCC 7336 TaxID=195250 RepID=UPI0003484D26|nr:hypothetical protein [Synechococcus sp. PCC 7336]